MSSASAETVREQLRDAVVAELLGPAEGPADEVVEASVRVRYLVGQLAPHNLVLEPDEQDELPKDGTTVAVDGEPEEDRLQSQSPMPSSIGLTFAVGGETKRIQVIAKWGRYEKRKSDGIYLTPSGETRMVWKRSPAGGIVEIAQPASTVIATPDRDGVMLPRIQAARRRRGLRCDVRRWGVAGG